MKRNTPENYSQREIALPPMPKTMEYFKKKHDAVADTYANDHCGLIAADMAEKLIADGFLPHIEHVYGEIHPPSGYTEVVKLTPLKYKGKMDPWHAHAVCCNDEFAFDPILDGPVPKKDYTRLLFGRDVKMKLEVPAEKTKKYVISVLG